MNIRTFTEPAVFSERSKKFFTTTNWIHWITVLAVYSITGTLVMLLSRLILNGALQMDGSFASGPWAYRGLYLLTMPPLYSVMLITVGTAFGKHQYFRQRVLRIWGRLLPIRRGAKIGL